MQQLVGGGRLDVAAYCSDVFRSLLAIIVASAVSQSQRLAMTTPKEPNSFVDRSPLQKGHQGSREERKQSMRLWEVTGMGLWV